MRVDTLIQRLRDARAAAEEPLIAERIRLVQRIAEIDGLLREVRYGKGSAATPGRAPRPYVKADGSPSQRSMILAYVAANPGCMFRDIREGVGDLPALAAVLSRIVKSGFVRRDGMFGSYRYFPIANGAAIPSLAEPEPAPIERLKPGSRAAIAKRYG